MISHGTSLKHMVEHLKKLDAQNDAQRVLDILKDIDKDEGCEWTFESVSFDDVFGE